MDRCGEYPRCLWKYNIWQAKQFISNTVTTGGRGKSNPHGGSNPCRGCDCLCWIYWVRGEGKLYLEGARLSAPKTLISLTGPRLWIMQHVREHLSSTHTHTHTHTGSKGMNTQERRGRVKRQEMRKNDIKRMPKKINVIKKPHYIIYSPAITFYFYRIYWSVLIHTFTMNVVRSLQASKWTVKAIHMVRALSYKS